MKLYSSTFISIILAFVGYIGVQNEEIVLDQGQDIPVFSDIIKPEIIKEVQNDEEKELISTPLTLNIEYFDKTNCIECDSFVINTLPKLKEKYFNENWVNFHIYFTPDMNSDVEVKTIMGTKCAASQNKFWEMHEAIHSGEKSFSKLFYQEFSKKYDLDIEVLHECLTTEKYLDSINSDIEYFEKYNIESVPLLIINDYKMIGNQPIENIEMIIDEIIMNHDM